MNAKPSIPLSPFHCPIPLRRLSRPGLKERDTVVSVGAYGLPQQTKVRVVK